MSEGTDQMLRKYGRRHPTKRGKVRALENAFENRIWDAFRCIGLNVRELGHKKPGEAAPDGLAWFRGNKSFILMLDGKISANPYVITVAHRRAFRDYVFHWSSILQGKGYERLYLVIVSSSFSGENASAIRDLKGETQQTLLADIVFMPAASLLYLVEIGVRDPTVGRSFFERLLEAANPVVSPLAIRRIYREEREMQVLD